MSGVRTRRNVRGYPGKKFTATHRSGLRFSAGTPAEYVARIRSEVVKMFADAAINRLFTDQGLIPVASTPEEFGKTIVDDIEYQRRLVAQMGLKPQ